MLVPFQLISLISVTVLGLAAAYILHVPLAFGFVVGLGLLIRISYKAGIQASFIRRSMWNGVKHTKEVIWILILVGLLIPSWTASGTIPYLIDIGLKLLDPSYMLTFSFLFAAVISMVLGTSAGTLSSVGIPLMGVGAFLQIPMPLIAGALVSGAFVGDRTSPYSSAHQLVAVSTGTTVRKQYLSMLPTTLGAFAVTVVFFLIMDVRGSWSYNSGSVSGESYSSVYSYSLWLGLPVILLLGTILLRIKTRYGFLLSIAASLILGTVLQGVTLQEWLHDLWYGYQAAEFASLRTKGLSHMIGMIVLIALAGAFNGIMEETQMLQPYMLKLLGTSGSLFNSTFRTSLFGLGLGVVACTQTLPIMMTGRNLLPLWEKRFPREQLSRVVADSSLVFAAMVPWNMLAVLCGTVVGVPVEQYVVYAPFLWTLPLLTLSVSWVKDRKRSYQANVKSF